MTEDEALALLTVAMGYGPHSVIGQSHARRTLARLHASGAAIYKKKVFKQGRRPTKSTKMTPEIADAIRVAFRANPNMTQHEIAVMFNVNSGRVNEVLNGTGAF